MIWILVLAFLLLYYFMMAQAWRWVEGIAEVIKVYRTTKPEKAKWRLLGCGVLREEKSEVWDGFGHFAETSSGLYYWSIVTPFLFFPWSDLVIIQTKRHWSLRKYHHIKIEGFPKITWLVPSKAISSISSTT